MLLRRQPATAGSMVYCVLYKNPICAVLAHNVIFDLASGEAMVIGRHAPDDMPSVNKYRRWMYPPQTLTGGDLSWAAQWARRMPCRRKVIDSWPQPWPSTTRRPGKITWSHQTPLPHIKCRLSFLGASTYDAGTHHHSWQFSMPLPHGLSHVPHENERPQSMVGQPKFSNKLKFGSKGGGGNHTFNPSPLQLMILVSHPQRHLPALLCNLPPHQLYCC